MGKPAKTIFVFGIYLLLLGIVFLIAPEKVLNLVEVDSPEILPRVLGMMLLFMSYYYIRASILGKDMLDFFKWTVHTRVAAIFFLGYFVVMEYAAPVILVFGFIDLLGALWTRATLRASRFTFGPNFHRKYFN